MHIGLSVPYTCDMDFLVRDKGASSDSSITPESVERAGSGSRLPLLDVRAWRVAAARVSESAPARTPAPELSPAAARRAQGRGAEAAGGEAAGQR